MKFTPRSSAASMAATESSSRVGPKCPACTMVPSPIALTRKPVLPRIRCSIVSPLSALQVLQARPPLQTVNPGADFHQIVGQRNPQLIHTEDPRAKREVLTR